MSEPTTPDWRPDELTLFRNRYATWGRNWALAGVLAIAAGVWLATGLTTPVVGIVLASLGGTLGLIFGFAFWLTGRGSGRQLDGIRSGGYLARWTLDHDRWWAWQRARASKSRLVVLLVMGMLALGGLLVAGMIYSDGDTEAATWAFGLTIAAMPVTAIVFRLHQAPLPPPSMRTMPVIIGPGGVLTVGAYLQWRAFGMRFLGAHVEADPPTLAVRFEVSTQHSTVEHTLEIPVPADRLDEAHDVAAALNGG